MRYPHIALLIAVAFASLGGCGQTGPLYMPTEEAPRDPPAASGDTTVQQPAES